MLKNSPYLYLLFLLTLTVFLLTSIIGCQPSPKVHKDSFLAFGTIINVTLVDVSDEKAQEIFRETREYLGFRHRTWHAWKPGSLMRINSLLPYKTTFSMSPSNFDIMIRSKQLAIESQHLFNPAAGKLVELWGFHSDEPARNIPDNEKIEQIVKDNPTMEDIEINGFRLTSNNASVKIDYGAIAKGFALDEITSLYRDKGIRHALIDTGGDLKVMGQHGKRPWSIAIRNPRYRTDHKQSLAAITLKDGEAIFTSGDYERFSQGKLEKKRIHHIIDPRTGYPAQETQAVTVIDTDGARADAAATALFIAGPEKWVEIARSMKISNVLLVDKNGDIHISASMRKRLNFLQQRDVKNEVAL